MVEFWTQFFPPCFPKFVLLIDSVFGIWRRVARPKFIDVSEDLFASIIRVDGRFHSTDDSNVIVTTVRTFFLIVELRVGHHSGNAFSASRSEESLSPSWRLLKQSFLVCIREAELHVSIFFYFVDRASRYNSC